VCQVGPGSVNVCFARGYTGWERAQTSLHPGWSPRKRNSLQADNTRQLSREPLVRSHWVWCCCCQGDVTFTRVSCPAWRCTSTVLTTANQLTLTVTSRGCTRTTRPAGHLSIISVTTITSGHVTVGWWFWGWTRLNTEARSTARRGQLTQTVSLSNTQSPCLVSLQSTL